MNCAGVHRAVEEGYGHGLGVAKAKRVVIFLDSYTDVNPRVLVDLKPVVEWNKCSLESSGAVHVIRRIELEFGKKGGSDIEGGYLGTARVSACAVWGINKEGALWNMVRVLTCFVLDADVFKAHFSQGERFSLVRNGGGFEILNDPRMNPEYPIRECGEFHWMLSVNDPTV